MTCTSERAGEMQYMRSCFILLSVMLWCPIAQSHDFVHWGIYSVNVFHLVYVHVFSSDFFLSNAVEHVHLLRAFLEFMHILVFPFGFFMPYSKMRINIGFTGHIFRMITLSSLKVINLHHPTELIYSQLLQEEPLGWFKYRLSDAIPE